MIGASLPRIIAVLIAANAVAALAVWRSVGADLPPMTLTGSFPAPSTDPETVQSPFKKVVRLGEPAAAGLFGRHPEITKAAEAPEPDVRNSEAAMRLVGVMFVDGSDQEPVALIEHGTPARVTRLRAGALLNPSNWRVERILPSVVELTRGGDHRTLKLDQNP